MHNKQISDKEYKKNVKAFVEDPGCSPRHTTETIAMSCACGSFVFLLLTFGLTRISLSDVLLKMFTQIEASIMEGIAIAGVVYSVIFGVYFFVTYGNGSKTAAVRVYMHLGVAKVVLTFQIIYLVSDSVIEYMFDSTAGVMQILLLWILMVMGSIVLSVLYIKRRIRKGELPVETEVGDIVIVAGLVLVFFSTFIGVGYTLTMLALTLVFGVVCGSTYSFCVYKMKLSYAKKYNLEKYLPQMEKINTKKKK